MVVLLEVFQLRDELVDKHAEKTAFAKLPELRTLRNDEQSEPQRNAGRIESRLRLKIRMRDRGKEYVDGLVDETFVAAPL